VSKSMSKTILITGSTDGLGLATAKMLLSLGHNILLHGRNPEKLQKVQTELTGSAKGQILDNYVADLSRMDDVTALADAVIEKQTTLDVLINNAGVFNVPKPITQDGLDIRFVVNTFAPYLLTQRLLALLGPNGRVVNLSSAAQAPVDLEVLAGRRQLSDDFSVYAQSKLALTMWSRSMAQSLDTEGLAIIAVNPGSLLATNMVRDAFKVAGNDISMGAEILTRAALSDEFASASGQYFDNDSGSFAPPHQDALDTKKVEKIVQAIEGVLTQLIPSR